MQMEGLRKLQNLPLRYAGALDCFVSLYRTQGFFGLWIGWIPNCQRAALLNMADIATYDFVKHRLIREFSFRDNWVTHAVSSACAGLSAAIVSLPSDVVKTRMMDQIRHELDAKMWSSHEKHPRSPLQRLYRLLRKDSALRGILLTLQGIYPQLYPNGTLVTDSSVRFASELTPTSGHHYLRVVEVLSALL
ncbi:unnamed protein product [Strongylus vulgaris]|uniref:Mitochondrial carrier protein n=1 Tax=Strongylus vulgaris TaxID=40348 RepID=A0A3P7IQE4_STRVU|nr:unnamed protein product [Strongylus vulgaris]